MYIFIINSICFYLGFFSRYKKKRIAFKIYLSSCIFELLLFSKLGLKFSFTEYFSIVAIECFILSLIIIKVYGYRKAFPFYVYNAILSFTYIYNIYSVNVLDNTWLWKIIYNNQEIIGFISVLLLLDVRVLKNVIRKYYVKFGNIKFFDTYNWNTYNFKMDKRIR